jgi:serine/threonine protein kinase
LRDRIRHGLPRLEAVRLIARVARAVAYAHEHGLVHRDLKPGNVLVSERGVIRLTDFGVSKALEDEEGITATGALLGTPAYMAPEQVEDAKRVGPEADIYSLGVILYLALTGRLPFAGKSLNEVLDRVLEGDLVAPREIDSTIDPELEAICLKAMSVAPADRHGSAMDFARALDAWGRRAAPPRRVTLRAPGKDR